MFSFLQRSAPAEVKEVEENGQKKLIITRDGAEVEVYLFGGTLTKFKTSTGKDVIWLSSTAKLDGTKAIRGGIPLVFPQFGQPIKEMAQHGFARNNVWTLDSKTDDGVVLTLDNTQATHDAWKHPYKLQFTIALNAQKLTTTYSVENTGSEAFTFHSLQHTYLDVGDISKTEVSGLDGKRFLDKTAADPTALVIETRKAATINEFTDRVYVGAGSGQITVKCIPGMGSYLQARKEGEQEQEQEMGSIEVTGTALLKIPGSEDCAVTPDIVVWNPWEEKAKGMGDFDDEGYKNMLCIEPGLVSGFHALPAGATFELVQALSVS